MIRPLAAPPRRHYQHDREGGQDQGQRDQPPKPDRLAQHRGAAPDADDGNGDRADGGNGCWKDLDDAKPGPIAEHGADGGRIEYRQPAMPIDACQPKIPIEEKRAQHHGYRTQNELPGDDRRHRRRPALHLEKDGAERPGERGDEHIERAQRIEQPGAADRAAAGIPCRPSQAPGRRCAWPSGAPSAWEPPSSRPERHGEGDDRGASGRHMLHAGRGRHIPDRDVEEARHRGRA